MGLDIISGGDGDVTVRRIGAGRASGFSEVTPAIVIATARRTATYEGYVVLTLAEAAQVAKAITAYLTEE